MAFMCPELGICELLPDDPDEDEGIVYRVADLATVCEEALVFLWDAKALEETPALVELLKSIDLDDAREGINSSREEWAIESNYPALKTHWNRRVAIPYIRWEMPQEDRYVSKADFAIAIANWEQEKEAEKEAWEILLCKGKDDQRWIDWIHWVTKKLLPTYQKKYRKKVWEEWEKVGLPVLPFEETLKRKKPL
jgi:hypothetical protein